MHMDHIREPELSPVLTEYVSRKLGASPLAQRALQFVCNEERARSRGRKPPPRSRDNWSDQLLGAAAAAADPVPWRILASAAAFYDRLEGRDAFEDLAFSDVDDDAIRVAIRFPYHPHRGSWRERLWRYRGRLEDGSDEALLAELAAREDPFRYPAKLGEALARMHQRRGDWLWVAKALDWCGPTLWENNDLSNQYDEADEARDRRVVAALERVPLRRYIDTPTAPKRLALVALRRGNFEEATSWASIAVEEAKRVHLRKWRGEELAAAYELMGHLARGSGNLNDEEAWLRKSIDSGNSGARVHLIRLLVRQGRQAEAGAEFEEELSEEPALTSEQVEAAIALNDPARVDELRARVRAEGLDRWVTHSLRIIATEAPTASDAMQASMLALALAVCNETDADDYLTNELAARLYALLGDHERRHDRTIDAIDAYRRALDYALSR